MGRSAFIASGDFEVDATQGQRRFLSFYAGILTDDKHLPPKIVAQRCNLPWLSRGKAEQLIAAMGKPTDGLSPEGTKAAREYLLSIALPGADKGAPKVLRAEAFTELWCKGQEQAKAAAESVDEDGKPAVVWIAVGPGTTSFAKWLIEQKFGEKNSMGKGVAIPIPGNEAKATAFASKLAEVIVGASVCKMVEVQQHEIPAHLLQYIKAQAAGVADESADESTEETEKAAEATAEAA